MIPNVQRSKFRLPIVAQLRHSRLTRFFRQVFPRNVVDGRSIDALQEFRQSFRRQLLHHGLKAGIVDDHGQIHLAGGSD